jgi:outer membrane protein assembly factor BamB
MLGRLALAAVVASFTAAAAVRTDQGEELRDAARAGDVDRVRALLDAGAPVDAPGRHGVTPLLLAATKGHLDAVRLLVERGAAVNARESFFRSTPLEMALSGGHRDVALLLLARGARDGPLALEEAVDRSDVELARAALATGRVEPLDLRAARKRALGKGSPEIRRLLTEAEVPRRRRAPYAATAEKLRSYAGRYASSDGPVSVSVRGEELLVTGSFGELALVPIDEDRFETAAGEAAMAFGGRGGLIEWATVNRGGDVTRLSVVTADPQPLKTSSGPDVAEEAPRAEGRPWPQFRGPGASGIGDGQGAARVWDVGKGLNVRFKTPVPGLALSSPIVWGDRVFLTTALGAAGDRTFRTGLYGDGTSVDDLSEHSFRLLALDTSSGRVLWDREVHRSRPTVRRHLKSSLANATPATDGRRVVVLFGPAGVLAAYDPEGRPLWKREIGVLDCNDPQAGAAEWGHASSPVLYEDLVLVQADRRKDSFLAAYRLASGEEAWRVARDEPSTWATPNVVRAPSGDELVTNGQTVRAYDPRRGTLLWTLGPNSEVVVATPVVGAGMAYVTAGYPPVRPVYAVRAGHRGDLRLPPGERASAAVAWSHARGGTYIPTPLLYRGHLYTLNNNGILTGYRADTGEQVYQTRLGAGATSFSASPIAADGRLYFASEAGEVYVLRAGPSYELLATNPMDEVVMATPALSDGLLVVRTLGHVVGIAEDGKTDTAR